MAAPSFVGRVAEVRRALSAIEAEPVRTVVLLGPPGIGKSSTLEVLRRRLARDGRVVERVVAATVGLDLTLAPFSRFIDAPGPRPGDLSALVTQVVNSLRSKALRSPTVLMVDDAHDLDDASAVVVRQLAHGGEIAVVMAARSTERLPPDLEHLLDDPGVETVELDPLAREDTDVLVRTYLEEWGGRQPDAPRGRSEVAEEVLEGVWRWSKGVPFLVRDLLVSSVHSGALAVDADRCWVQREPLTTSTRFADSFGRRIERLGPSCDRLVRSLAVAGPLPIRVVDALTSPEQRLAAERSGILRRRADDPAGETVTFAHDLYREVASSWLSPGERRQLASEVSDLLASPPMGSPDEVLLRAELSLRAGELGTSDPEVYARGAEVACMRYYDGRRALCLAEAALERGAGLGTDLVRLAALGLLGRGDEASRGYVALETRVRTPVEAALVASAHAWHLLLDRGDAQRTVEILDRGIERAPTALAEELRGQRVTALFFGGRAAEGAEAGARWVDEPACPPPVMAFGLVSALAVTGRASDAFRLSERALQAPDPKPFGGELVTISMVWNRLLARWQLGRLGELGGPFDGLPMAELPGVSAPWMRSAITATFELLRGHLARSVSSYRSVWDQLVLGPPQVVAMNTLLRAMAETHLGRIAGAHALLGQLEQLPTDTTRPFRWWVGRTRVLLLAGETRFTEAVRRSLELADAHAGEHFYVTTSLHDVVRFGKAKLVRDRLAAQAERPHSTWWDEVCAEHAAAAGADVRDTRRLLEVADRFERGGRDLDALEALVQAAAVASEAGASTQSRVLAVAASSRVEQRRARCGDPKTPLLVSVPSRLTEREYLVSRLAAAGLSNAEIAERLGTSVRTVGNQLQSVYLKLGVHSRDDLRGFVD